MSSSISVWSLEREGLSAEQVRDVAMSMKREGKHLWGWLEYEQLHFARPRQSKENTHREEDPPVHLNVSTDHASTWVYRVPKTLNIPANYIETCIAYLPKEQQQVVYWHYALKWPMATIAYQLRSPVSTVEATQRSAFEEMKSAYRTIRKMEAIDE